MTDPALLAIARAFVGLREISGVTSESVIVNWAKDLGIPSYTNDDTAWCALFMSRLCMAAGLPLPGRNYDLLRAKSFMTWGQPMTAPSLGCVLVFQRPDGGHVGLYAGERPDAYYVLGGNQGDAVSYTWVAKSRLVAMRWPDGGPVPMPSPVLLAQSGDMVSHNEA